MGKKASRGNKNRLQGGASQEVATQVGPACDQAKLRADLSTYMHVSSQLRAKRGEMYEADRRGTLKDRQALDMSVEVAKLKRTSDKLRLEVCEQLRSFVEEIHRHLAASSDRVADSDRDSDDRTSKFSMELADKCVELLRCVTTAAIKEEMFEAKRLLRNLQLHNGRSCVYVLVRSRYRVRPRSW
ncbi:uncharacterized protein IUM83_16481 [Phytophthora cinnamomi]|uniref:uncharacterized protein n=1 Tax=Phytophthora cinnamomi TaxID=4785 RepID=UPI003559CA7C|nr:hypothetical protein IUM83_16481 [Phytophthora cinnamomi]